MSSKQAGGGSAKIGRHKRAPSNANQPMRSAKNKRLRIEREARRQELFKKLKSPEHAVRQQAKGGKLKTIRGTARRNRRQGITRQP